MVLQSQEEQRIDGRGGDGVPSSHDPRHGGDHSDREACRGRDCRYVIGVSLSLNAFSVAYRLQSRIGRIAAGSIADYNNCYTPEGLK